MEQKESFFLDVELYNKNIERPNLNDYKNIHKKLDTTTTRK